MVLLNVCSPICTHIWGFFKPHFVFGFIKLHLRCGAVKTDCIQEMELAMWQINLGAEAESFQRRNY